ncbi:MAG: hypothetical protein ABW252_06710 [Polyangiales bacterium]
MGLICLLGLGACAPTIKQAARQASQAAVEEGAQELANEDTQEKLKQAANDPDVQEATRAMTDQIADGILKALESDRAHAQIASLTRAITQSAMQQLVAALGAPQTRAQLIGLTNAVTEAALQQAARSLHTDLRPAVREMIRDDFGRGMAAALDQQLQPALGATAQNVAYHAVLGANHGLGSAWTGDDGIAGEVREGESALPSIFWLGLAMMGLFALMLTAGAVMMVARARRTRAEVARLENATLLLATAMRTAPAGSPESGKLLAMVHEALERSAHPSGKHRVIDEPHRKAS